MTALEDRTQWLLDRRQGIGASDVAALLGLSPWASPWSIWADKMGLLPEVTGEHLEAGHWLELAIGPWAADRLGLHLHHPQRSYTHPEHSWMRCTGDGELAESPTVAPDPPEVLLEIKTTGPGPEWDTIPVHYRAQVGWQMAVTDATRVIVARLAGRRLDLHAVERDHDMEADIAFMIEHAKRFWHDHVLTKTPPPVDATEATAAAIAAVYPHGDPNLDAVPLDPALIEQLHTAKAAAKTAQAAVTAAENAICAAMGDHTIAVHDGAVIATWKPQERTGIDAKKLRRLAHPHIVDQVTTRTEFRVLRPKKGTT